ncbi:MAG: hypothetical protein MR802_07185 [Prevotella sp.]|nr:hypothetical protein [Prevotella sp.]
MKKYILPLMSIAMLMAMASCSSSDDAVEEIKEESKLVPMTCTATQESNAGTRSALNGSYGVDWQTSDKISVFDGQGNQEFTLTGDVEDGKFYGTASSTATSFTAVYPYTEGAQLESTGIVNGITLPAVQTATPNSFDPNAALMMAVSTTDKKYNLDFKNAVSLVKIQTEFACKKIVLSANEDIAGTGTLTMTFDNANDTYTSSFTFSSGNSSTITLKPATGESFDAGTYYIVVPPITLTNGFIITFTAENDKEYTRKSTQSNTFNRSKIKDFGSFATTGDYWCDAARGAKVRADQEVDLGLTITIGEKNYKVIFTKSNLTKDGLAENEYDYGDFFAWGATEPWYNSYTIDSYGTPKVASDGWKEGHKSGYVETPTLDNKYTYIKDFEMSDDPAHKILGGDWQLPTTEIWQALNTSSNWSWTIKGGKKGMEVENYSTNNSIFLPVAGRGSGTSFYLGDYGFYWSGTAHSSTSAYYLFFRNGQISAADYYDRYYGLLVRPVRLVAVD